MKGRFQSQDHSVHPRPALFITDWPALVFSPSSSWFILMLTAEWLTSFSAGWSELILPPSQLTVEWPSSGRVLGPMAQYWVFGPKTKGKIFNLLRINLISKRYNRLICSVEQVVAQVWGFSDKPYLSTRLIGSGPPFMHDPNWSGTSLWFWICAVTGTWTPVTCV